MFSTDQQFGLQISWLCVFWPLSSLGTASETLEFGKGESVWWLQGVLHH